MWTRKYWSVVSNALKGAAAAWNGGLLVLFLKEHNQKDTLF
jgi:hypothetical protein